MRSFKATWRGLMAILVSMAGGRELRAGSMTYTWAATSNSSIFEVDGVDASGGVIGKYVDLHSGVVRLWYSPDQEPGLTSTTVGDTALFSMSAFQFTITLGPDFYQGMPSGVEIIAPPPGGGLDVMIFSEIGDNLHQTGAGTLEIVAPNGTIKSLSQLPANLDAFASYALNHVGGDFSYEQPWTYTFPFFSGGVEGILGGAVPEPSSIVSMMIGTFLPFSVPVARRFRRWRGLSTRSERSGRTRAA
jgi:hypothetical protein